MSTAPRVLPQVRDARLNLDGVAPPPRHDFLTERPANRAGKDQRELVGLDRRGMFAAHASRFDVTISPSIAPKRGVSAARSTGPGAVIRGACRCPYHRAFVIRDRANSSGKVMPSAAPSSPAKRWTATPAHSRAAR